jgi:hypothetical protein
MNERRMAQRFLRCAIAMKDSLSLRRRCFLFMLQHVARVDDSRRIDRDVSFVDVTNDAFFVDQESGAISKALLLIKNTVVIDDRAFKVAEDREGNSNLLCEFAVGGNTVYTQTKNLSVGCFEFSDISLIRF